MSERVPDLVVEKLALGELPDEQARALRSRLEADGDDRLARIERSNAEILQEHPPQQVAAAIERRLARLAEDDERRPARGGWLLLAPVAAAAGLALVWWVGRGGAGERESGKPDMVAVADSSEIAESGGPGEVILLKGDPQLLVDRIEDERPVRMTADQSVKAGDRLQVSYRAAGAMQGAIVSIDGAGVATLHFPAAVDEDPRLHQGGRIPLRESYELDDAPGFERFFFVTVGEAEPRLDVAAVVDAAERLARSDAARSGELVLPAGWRQQSLLLLK